MVQVKGLPINYKVKLKGYTLALEPIIYFRMLSWKATHHKLEDIFFITDLERELEVLAKVKEAYSIEMKEY